MKAVNGWPAAPGTPSCVAKVRASRVRYQSFLKCRVQMPLLHTCVSGARQAGLEVPFLLHICRRVIENLSQVHVICTSFPLCAGGSPLVFEKSRQLIETFSVSTCVTDHKHAIPPRREKQRGDLQFPLLLGSHLTVVRQEATTDAHTKSTASGSMQDRSVVYLPVRTVSFRHWVLMSRDSRGCHGCNRQSLGER